MMTNIPQLTTDWHSHPGFGRTDPSCPIEASGCCKPDENFRDISVIMDTIALYLQHQTHLYGYSLSTTGLLTSTHAGSLSAL